MSIEPENKDLELRLKDARGADLQSGHVIYVKDKHSRLHDRVLLVIRQKEAKAYFSCLALCCHRRPFDELRDY